jgi:flagellar biosynthesis protein FlhG
MGLWPLGTNKNKILRETVNVKEMYPAGPRAIAVASGKGGVGKTSLSVNLAICLAKMGCRITLFDADLGMANVEVMLGLAPPYSLYDVLFGDKSLEEIIVQGPQGINIISGGSGFLQMANLDQQRRKQLITMLNQFSNQDDFLIIDTGAGISKNVLGFVAAAGEVIIVATPEPTSLTDAYALIKVLANFKIPSEIHIVINRSYNGREARRTLDRLQATTGRFLNIKINSLGWLPEDRLVSQAIKSQEPFVLTSPNSLASRSIVGIAQYLVNNAKPKQNEGFWGKLMALFGQGGSSAGRI